MLLWLPVQQKYSFDFSHENLSHLVERNDIEAFCSILTTLSVVKSFRSFTLIFRQWYRSSFVVVIRNICHSRWKRFHQMSMGYAYKLKIFAWKIYRWRAIYFEYVPWIFQVTSIVIYFTFHWSLIQNFLRAHRKRSH